MKALIIAASPSSGPSDVARLAGSVDFVIAADGGAAVSLAAGVRPDVVIGDMDSLPDDAVESLRRASVELVAFPPRKDETDLELALLEALRRGADEIAIAGALGGRLDHTLGNIYLLAMPGLEGRRVRLVDGNTEVFVIQERAELSGQVGDTVSLIPLTPEVAGVETEGLEYPLRRESLFMGPGRGISNVMTAATARVSIAGGTLLAVVIHQQDSGDEDERAL